MNARLRRATAGVMKWRILLSPSGAGLLVLFVTAMFAHGETDRSNLLALNDATVFVPETSSPRIQQAAMMLVEEVEKRTAIRWPIANDWPQNGQPTVAIGVHDSINDFTGTWKQALANTAQAGPEGYLLRSFSDDQAKGIAVVGNDERGVLYGAGRLLRELRMTKQAVQVARDLDIVTAPEYSMRGHQIGYRPKVNTYDAWTAPMFEQYIRDLAVFGVNAIEMIPPRSDDAPDSTHFPIPQIDMMEEISRIADRYGIDVWIWYPALDEDYSDPKTVEFALNEWGDVFARLPRIDAILVPGGDPGHTQPKYMMALLEKQTEVLHRTHPNAQMWMSPQSFTAEWMDEFIAYMQQEQPAWLSGIVFGPQNRISLPELRKLMPQQYPIRRYPDITHSIRCQYPVPDWDAAYAITEEREVINPRPMHYAQIFRLWDQEAVGFITYSEGVNDDVNKILWSELGWDPETPEIDILRDYGRYLIGDSYGDDFAQILLALERNWQGPLLTNTGVMTTLEQVRDLERAVPPQVLLNWRFQQVQYRAYYDAYVRTRLVYETDLEERAMDVLRQAERVGVDLALREAESILDKAQTEPVGQDLRGRVSDMAEALYQSIRMQHSVPRYRAIHAGRGGNFDLIDRPLNDRPWLLERFTEIRALETERDRLAKVAEIVNWTNPGPGGFYDDLGNQSRQPHLLRPYLPDTDPETRQSPLVAAHYQPGHRMSWVRNAETRFEDGLRVRYTNLDPAAQYKVRAIYAGDRLQAKLRLFANETIEIHPFMSKEVPFKPVEFEIPREATVGSKLTLTWYQEPGGGGSGRGCQVAEVWLIKVHEP